MWDSYRIHVHVRPKTEDQSRSRAGLRGHAGIRHLLCAGRARPRALSAVHVPACVHRRVGNHIPHRGAAPGAAHRCHRLWRAHLPRRRGDRVGGGTPRVDPEPATGNRAVLRGAARFADADVSGTGSGPPRHDRWRRMRHGRLDVHRYLDAGLGAHHGGGLRTGRHREQHRLPGAPRLTMADLSRFAITRRWPAAHPDRIQLYSLPTPNGVKVSIMLEETGLAYEPHLVDFNKNDQLSAEFRSLNPNNKIPALIDPNGPEGVPLPLFESGAILQYLADKSGQLIPRAPAARYECLQWVFFQVGGIGPMFGQLG